MVSEKPYKLGGMEGGEMYTGEPREEWQQIYYLKRQTEKAWRPEDKGMTS